MLVIGAPSRANVVGPSVFGANVLEEAAGESTTENLGGDFERGIVLVVKLAAKMSDIEKCLSDIGLGRHVYAGRGNGLHLWKGRKPWPRVFPGAQDLFELGFHFCCVEVAVDLQHHVGREIISVVEVEHILALDV